MTRFQQELSGQLGEYWVKSAQKEIEKVREEFEEGATTIDENGVAYNCIGRVLMSDMLEKLTYVTDKVNVEATNAAREIEVAKNIAEYKEYRQSHGYSAEEIAEMRAAFGPGQKIVDMFTGHEVYT